MSYPSNSEEIIEGHQIQTYNKSSGVEYQKRYEKKERKNHRAGKESKSSFKFTTDPIQQVLNTFESDFYSKKNKKMGIAELTRNIIDDLINEKIECLVCNDEIDHVTGIWSCSTCYTIFHMNCIYEWIAKLNSGEEKSDILKFTCPHCSHIYKYSAHNPPVYNCFCGKYNTSKYIDNSKILIPHSCGKSCDHKICDHIKCVLPCHPGPHTVCMENLENECFCGKEKRKSVCSFVRKTEGEYDGRFSCQNDCGKSIKCGIHSCKLPCHEGDCPGNASDERCDYCYEESKDIFKKVMNDVDKLANEIGINISFSKLLTNLVFDNKLPCGQHFLTESKVEANLKNILRIIKYSGEKLLINLRELFPLCKTQDANFCNCKSFNKPGFCYLINYPSELIVFLNYKSSQLLLVPNSETQEGETKNQILTHNPIGKLVHCKKICKTPKNCKNHVCTRECCELRGKETKGYSQDPNGFHICYERCNKKLKCGHECFDLCHKNPCAPCPFLIKDVPLICDCGGYTLKPPYRCSQDTKCSNPCLKDRECSHRCPLNCHKGACPKCLDKVTKPCVCSKTLVQNCVCSEDGFCDKQCGEILSCGVHICRQICHAHIEDINFFCSQACGRQKKCGHLCSANCHGESDCIYHDCQIKVRALCKCGTNFKVYSCSDVQAKWNCLKDKDPTQTEEFSVIILDCNDECAKKAKLFLFEKAFAGLKSYSDENSKIFIKLKDSNPGKEDPDAYLSRYCQFKFSSQMLNYAKSKTELITQVEDFIENHLSKLASNEVTNIFYCEKSELGAVVDLLLTIYNIKADKTFNKNTGKGIIKVVDCSLARLPRFRLSLFGLLFKYNKFVIKDYNADGPCQIFHPFQQSFYIKDYRIQNAAEEIEQHLLKQKIVSNEDDFYIDQTRENLAYVHFFDSDKCKIAFNYNSKIPSPFQNCYITDEYRPKQESSEVFTATTTTTANSSSTVSSKMYNYKSNSKYFDLLNEKEDVISLEIKRRAKEELTKCDDDGFVKVVNKKKK